MPDIHARLDQGRTSACTGFTGAHYLLAGPTTQPNVLVNSEYAQALYREAQKVDEWPGESYEGSSVRAVAKVLQARGLLQRYAFAWDIETMVYWLLDRGPIMAGTTWTNSMFSVDDDQFITVDYNSGIAGGHAYLVSGVRLVFKDPLGPNTPDNWDLEESYVRAPGPNSWGTGWGLNGHARIRLNDMRALIADDGEICAPVEIQKGAL
jgi:hypothetical protein